MIGNLQKMGSVVEGSMACGHSKTQRPQLPFDEAQISSHSETLSPWKGRSMD